VLPLAIGQHWLNHFLFSSGIVLHFVNNGFVRLHLANPEAMLPTNTFDWGTLIGVQYASLMMKVNQLFGCAGVFRKGCEDIIWPKGWPMFHRNSFLYLEYGNNTEG